MGRIARDDGFFRDAVRWEYWPWVRHRWVATLPWYVRAPGGWSHAVRLVGFDE